MALNEHLLKVNKQRFDELNITKAHEQGLTGNGVRIGIIGYSPNSHHNGAWLIQQVAPEAEIIEYNVMDTETPKLSWADAFKKMLDDDIQVICCSLIKITWDDVLKNLTQLLYDKNVIMITSSANDSREINRYPAKDIRWFAIGAGGKSGRDSYSNYGDNLLGLGYTSYGCMNYSGDYIPITHTSGATQVICGMAAMLKHINPNLTPIEFKEFVSKNAIKISSEEWNNKEGWGLISLPKEITPPEVKEPEPIEKPIEEVNNMIIDISHHQVPSNIDYDKLSNQVKLVIIRTQYGSSLIDRYYKTHYAEFKKRNIPCAAYAWVRGTSIKDMEVEATDFYNRTKDLKPIFWFLDVEEKSMTDMRNGITAYVNKLRSLGVKKIGIYIAHHLYKDFNLDLSIVDAVWIPHYGLNNGIVTSKPSYLCDIHQYTSAGRLDGYSGNLDLNRIISDKTLAYFTTVEEIKIPTPIPVPVIDEMGIAWEWGIALKITDGTRPNEAPTRKEIITMLHRMRGDK